MVEQRGTESSERSALLFGLVLVLVGGAALISQFWPDLDRYLALLVGLGLLLVFAFSRSYLALVFGALTTGVGVGLIVADVLPRGEWDGAATVLGLSGGFIATWLVSGLMQLKEHHPWPLVPGLILLAVGAGLTLEEIGYANLTEYVLPAALVVLGVLVMAVAFLRMRTTPGTT